MLLQTNLRLNAGRLDAYVVSGEIMKFLGISLFENGAATPNCVEQFNKTMDVAREIALTNPQALRELIRALLRPLQSEHILAAAERGDHKAPCPIEGNSFFFVNQELFSGAKHYLRNSPVIELNLAYDPILPTPWKRSGFVNALANIGVGKRCGAWKQESNHVVSLWLPWGIGFVGGGNHSIASGILSGKNIPITATEVFDFSPVLDLVMCDGKAYRNKQTGELLAKATDHRRAAVFEIGRLMKELNVSIS